MALVRQYKVFGKTASSFRINNRFYPRSEMELVINGDQVGLIAQYGYQKVFIHPAPYTDWLSEFDAPFADVQELVTYLSDIIFYKEFA